MAATDDDLGGAAISARVGGFYERHPYPPRVGNLASYGRAWTDARRRVDAHLLWPELPYREDRTILVAGCGTSQAAKYALRWPASEVTGIDLSEASLAETEKLKQKYDLRNLQLRQLPVERAGELGREYEYVVCTGVLHHLPDPAAGLCALKDVLAPGGAMHLMLYAPYGRAGVYMLQEYCRRLGIGTSSADIRELAATLGRLPPDHPFLPLLRKARDFSSEAGLADALLHPQDRAYSVPQLFDLLAGAGLSFQRWMRQAAYLPQCGSLPQTPHYPRLVKLQRNEQYAALELFRGSMVEHSLVARRDSDRTVCPVTFLGEDWLDYIPIRLPNTIVVEERLPPTAVAVLINRDHIFTDIYLPVDASQKRLFDAIDGLRSIREIVPDDALRRFARTLFERLWHYDQIVFDTSCHTKHADET